MLSKGEKCVILETTRNSSQTWRIILARRLWKQRAFHSQWQIFTRLLQRGKCGQIVQLIIWKAGRQGATQLQKHPCLGSIHHFETCRIVMMRLCEGLGEYLVISNHSACDATVNAASPKYFLCFYSVDNDIKQKKRQIILYSYELEPDNDCGWLISCWMTYWLMFSALLLFKGRLNLLKQINDSALLPEQMVVKMAW